MNKFQRHVQNYENLFKYISKVLNHIPCSWIRKFNVTKGGVVQVSIEREHDSYKNPPILFCAKWWGESNPYIENHRTKGESI